jgi:osmotically inducible lipoprotein OsmB
MRMFAAPLLIVALAFALSACGHNVEERAATGAATGLVLGGPIGAAVGAGVGTVVSKARDK